MPNEVLNSDIRYYRHSVFIANYILLHKRRNKGKKTENVISVNKLDGVILAESLVFIFAVLRFNVSVGVTTEDSNR